MSAVAIREETKLTPEEGRAELRRMIKDGEVEPARALSKQLLTQYPEDPAVQYWARVLEPPRFLGWYPGTGQGNAATKAWLKQHALEYRGQWIAVRAGEFIAAEPTREALMERLKDLLGGFRQVLVMQVRS